MRVSFLVIVAAIATLAIAAPSVLAIPRPAQCAS